MKPHRKAVASCTDRQPGQPDPLLQRERRTLDRLFQPHRSQVRARAPRGALRPGLQADSRHGILPEDAIASAVSGHEDIRRLGAFEQREYFLGPANRCAAIIYKKVPEDSSLIWEGVHLGIGDRKQLPKFVVHDKDRGARVAFEEIPLDGARIRAVNEESSALGRLAAAAVYDGRIGSRRLLRRRFICHDEVVAHDDLFLFLGR